MRTLSLDFRQAQFSQESGEVAIFLLTITHPELDTPLRISTDPTARLSTDPLTYGTVSRGNTFLFVAAETMLPEEKDRTPPATRLIISNVDRSTIPLARSVSSPPQVLIEMVLGSALDTVEMSVPVMDVINLQYDAAQLTFDVAIDALATEGFPAGTFDPASFPGLFI